jgi:DNA-binding SARP family transcriptional activator/class 3 adenylate cyclase
VTAQKGVRPVTAAVRVRLLGPFRLSLGPLEVSAWPRPTAKRLVELVLISPGGRVTRDLACEALFPEHGAREANRALIKALSMARDALAGLGGLGEQLLCSDRDNIWVGPGAALEVDAERHEEALRAALAMSPGQARDDQLVAALAEDATLLAEEPYADWAIGPRDRLDGLRQQARLALARDRAKGSGRPGPEAVIEAWEDCLEYDRTCEEAAAALVRAYGAQGLRPLALRAYERCRKGLEELGLRPSPALEEVGAGTVSIPYPTGPRRSLATVNDERRVVSVLFAEVMAVPGALKEDPEELRDVVGDALTSAITAIEGLGGTVTSVSGAGLQALFGAPEAHEDDPERAVRAAFHALSESVGPAAPVLRVGVETGPAIVGLAPIEAGAGSYYRIVGAVVSAAAALQSVANAGSVLVGPTTRAATEGLFEWGPTEEVLLAKEAKPLVGAYLQRPRATAPARQLRLGGRGPLVGREAELSALVTVLRNTQEGHGSVVVIEGEPGLGKTRLIQECRKRFMAWVGARSGRLPLWAEGRCASYASTSPYNLYRQLVASWAGVAPDQPEAIVGPALERALVAVMGDRELWPVLARMMDLAAGAQLAPMRPADRQRATFAALRGLLGAWPELARPCSSWRTCTGLTPPRSSSPSSSRRSLSSGRSSCSSPAAHTLTPGSRPRRPPWPKPSVPACQNSRWRLWPRRPNKS